MVIIEKSSTPNNKNENISSTAVDGIEQ